MRFWEYAGLAAAGALAGGMNALAGGGGFITLPALMFTGSTAIFANTTGTVAVWPGIASSFFAYRRHLRKQSHPLKIYAILSLTGGALGAALLLLTSNRFFLALLPYLLLLATLLFAFGRPLTGWAMGLQANEDAALPRWVTYPLLYLIAVYGGYFGGGMGIMTLALLTLMGMRDIHEMNALKTFCTLLINGVAVAVFIILRKVDWLPCLVMMGGGVWGGYFVGRFAPKVPQVWIRGFITALASGLTAYYFLHNRAL